MNGKLSERFAALKAPVAKAKVSNTEDGNAAHSNRVSDRMMAQKNQRTNQITERRTGTAPNKSKNNVKTGKTTPRKTMGVPVRGERFFQLI
jgi:hypothetical protein